MTEETKTMFDACMKMVEVHNTRRHEREGFEWKLSIAFWTLIAAALAFLGEHPHANIPCWLRTVGAISGFCIYLIFANGLAEAHGSDSNWSKHYRARAAVLLGDPVAVEPLLEPQELKLWTKKWARSFFPHSNAWGQWFQIGTTAFLLIAFVYLSEVIHPRWDGIWGH